MKRILLCLLLLPSFTVMSMEQEKQGDVILDLEGGNDVSELTVVQWKEQLTANIKRGKGDALLKLLAPEGQPKDRSLFAAFKPYDDALEAINAHRERERRILMNEADPDNKYFKCCNGTYVWNRFGKPVILGGVKAIQISAGLWGIIKAVSNPAVFTSDLEKVISNTTAIQELITSANNSVVTNAGPSILQLIAASVVIPFTLKEIYHALILKEKRSKFEWYTIAKKLVEVQDEIEKTVKENNEKLEKLLEAKLKEETE